MSNLPEYFTPQNMRIYAIGDVHGCVDLLSKMHEEISMDLLRNPPEHVHIVYLGDYIDKGPDSRAVMDMLIERQARGDGIPKTFLRGNHEDALFDFMDDPLAHKWLQWGGVETLASYGITFGTDIVEGILPSEKEEAAEKMREALPAEHADFIKAMPLSLTLGDYFFAHAGVDPVVAFDQQDARDLTFMREPFLSWNNNPLYAPLPQKVVHGHSPSQDPQNLPHRIGVDTGACDSGVLTAVVLEGTDVRFISVE